MGADKKDSAVITKHTFVEAIDALIEYAEADLDPPPLLWEATIEIGRRAGVPDEHLEFIRMLRDQATIH